MNTMPRAVSYNVKLGQESALGSDPLYEKNVTSEFLLLFLFHAAGLFLYTLLFL